MFWSCPPAIKNFSIQFLCLLVFLGGFIYFGVYWQLHSDTEPSTRLTHEEWLWLTENPDKLVIANTGEHPPFFYLNQRGQWTGLAFDYLAIIEKRLGCQFRHLYFEGTKELRAALTQKEIAFVLDAEPAVADYAGLLYTEYVSSPFAIYMRDSSEGRKSLELDDLTDMEIAVSGNSAASHYMEQYSPKLRINTTDSDLTALLRLASGNSDAAFVNQGTAAYYFDELRLTELRRTVDVDESLSMNYGVRPDMPELHRILNKSLEGIDEKYRRATAVRWLKQQPHSFFSSARVKNIILAAVFGTALVAAAFFAWNRALRQQVAIQTRELHQALEDRYEMERQLLQTSKVEALGSLASGIAHDFNNMLTAIIGYTEVKRISPHLSESELTSVLLKQQDKIEKIGAVADRARNLVQKILSFARNRDIKPTCICATSAIQDCLKFADGLFPRTFLIKMQFSASEDRIWTDPSYITQILINLLSNASDAMAGKGQVIIKTDTIIAHDEYISANKKGFCLPFSPGEYFSLIVQDSGTGIPQEVQERMFEPFFTTKALNQGTGMGLHIIRDIVRRLGGTIWFESSNQGTVFQVLLPLWRENERVNNEGSKVVEKIRQPDTTGGQRTAVLYVEDDDHIREKGSCIMTQLGCFVHESASGEEALDLIGSGEIRELGLILTDYVLPGMSGLDLALETRRMYPETPIVLCSGREDLVHHMAWKQAGISEFFSKPMQTRDYARLLRHCYRRG